MKEQGDEGNLYYTVLVSCVAKNYSGGAFAAFVLKVGLFLIMPCRDLERATIYDGP